MELLIRVVDRTGSDIYKDVGLTKRGHVIVVKPDGHDWAKDELTHPAWRIVRVNCTEAEANAMLAAEPGLETNRMLQRRAFRLDVDHLALPPAVKLFLSDDSRQTPIAEITLNQMRAIKTQTKPKKDPDPLP